MLDKGFIHKSTSPAAAPLLFVAKSGGSMWICHNYWDLNTVIIKNWYPLLLIHKTLNAFYGIKYFTKLDMIVVFNQIQIAKGYKWLTAFITQFRLYKMLVTLFSFCNALVIFQNYINYILHNTLNNNCTTYFNDVFVFSKIYAKHTKHVNEVI